MIISNLQRRKLRHPHALRPRPLCAWYLESGCLLLNSHFQKGLVLMFRIDGETNLGPWLQEQGWCRTKQGFIHWVVSKTESRGLGGRFCPSSQCRKIIYLTMTCPPLPYSLRNRVMREWPAASAKDARMTSPAPFVHYPDTGCLQESQKRQFYFKENIFKCNLQFIHEE